ncbi:hypothetical protein DENSPDRAFT_831947 [Dentipellis sp. KUC8613]|nr:hypothetical protein DENSPDRAFT_831947 [Dentipellis sp. KUC8613]
MGQTLLQTLLHRVRHLTSRHPSPHYELEPLFSSTDSLPSSSNAASRQKHTSPSSLPRRLLRLFTLRRIFLSILGAFILFVVSVLLWGGIPPSYSDIRAYEKALPQHNLSLPSPEGAHGQFLRFPDHLWGHGLNNVLQEILLQSQLAHTAGRAYVFEDYTWSHLPLPWTLYDYALRPARLPLNAFISGPSAGAPMPAPRAVSAKFWEEVCGKKARRRAGGAGNATQVVTLTTEGVPEDAEGDVLMQWWADKLKSVGNSTCVQVVQGDQPAFDQNLFGSTRVLSLWPALSASPILANFTWSPLVHAAVTRNFALLRPPSPAQLVSPGAPPLPGLVAVHLRRGDFVRHCPRLYGWDAPYMGFNRFAALPAADAFDPPPKSQPDARRAYYMEHCFPERAQIVHRLAEVRRDNPGLRRVYLLTNGWGSWVQGVRDALMGDGWEDVRSGQELVLDEEQNYVAMAVDMAIAERAEVFVGNGFSSLSANIVMFRMAKGLEPASNRIL